MKVKRLEYMIFILIVLILIIFSLKNKSLLVIEFDIKLFLAPSFIKKENKRQSLKLSLD